jgi:hypothetical protein
VDRLVQEVRSVDIFFYTLDLQPDIRKGRKSRSFQPILAWLAERYDNTLLLKRTLLPVFPLQELQQSHNFYFIEKVSQYLKMLAKGQMHTELNTSILQFYPKNYSLIHLKIQVNGWVLLMPVILATQKAEIRSKTISQKNPIQNRAGGVAQVIER